VASRGSIEMLAYSKLAKPPPIKLSIFDEKSGRSAILSDVDPLFTLENFASPDVDSSNSKQ
jgi:hypothetical protein